MEIKLDESEKKGLAYIGDRNDPKAAITYSKAGSKLIIIDHTEVDDSLRGQGAGKQMLYKIVEMVREKDLKILPLCPFAKSVFEKEESIGDVLQ